MEQYKLALVIPCFNEEKRLNVDAFLEELSNNSNLTFVFVDDGSKDNSLQIIKKICQLFPDQAFFLPLKNNVGKGEAVRKGMLSVLGREGYDIIGFWDADLAVPLNETWDFMKLFSNPNVSGVISSRVHLSGRKIERINLRHYMGRLFATLISSIFNLTYYDTQCGAKLFRSEILAPVIQSPFSCRWIFDVELLIRIHLQFNLKNKSFVYEMPVNEWKDVQGTKRTLSAYFVAVFDFLTLVKMYKWDDKN